MGIHRFAALFGWGQGSVARLSLPCFWLGLAADAARWQGPWLQPLCCPVVFVSSAEDAFPGLGLCASALFPFDGRACCEKAFGRRHGCGAKAAATLASPSCSTSPTVRRRQWKPWKGSQPSLALWTALQPWQQRWRGNSQPDCSIAVSSLCAGLLVSLALWACRGWPAVQPWSCLACHSRRACGPPPWAHTCISFAPLRWHCNGPSITWGPAGLPKRLYPNCVGGCLFAGIGGAAAQLLASLGEARGGPPGGAAELSPVGLLSLLHALQWMLRLEASAVQLFAQHPQLGTSLLLLLQPQALAAMGAFAGATGGCSGDCHRQGPGERPSPEAVAAAVACAATGVLSAPFLHAHASPQIETWLAQLQQSLAAAPGAAAALLHCLQLAGATGDTGWRHQLGEGPECELLTHSVGLLARLVMASDRAMAQFVAAGGMAPAVVDK